MREHAHLSFAVVILWVCDAAQNLS